MNDPVVTARVLLCLLAVVPSVVGYYWIKYYDYFPQHSLRQFALMSLGLFILLGTTFFQLHVYLVVGHIEERRFVGGARGPDGIDIDELAKAPQLVNLLIGIDEKALQQERRIQPGPIQFGHEHAML